MVLEEEDFFLLLVAVAGWADAVASSSITVAAASIGAARRRRRGVVVLGAMARAHVECSGKGGGRGVVSARGLGWSRGGLGRGEAREEEGGGGGGGAGCWWRVSARVFYHPGPHQSALRAGCRGPPRLDKKLKGVGGGAEPRVDAKAPRCVCVCEAPKAGEGEEKSSEATIFAARGARNLQGARAATRVGAKYGKSDGTVSRPGMGGGGGRAKASGGGARPLILSPSPARLSSSPSPPSPLTRALPARLAPTHPKLYRFFFLHSGGWAILYDETYQEKGLRMKRKENEGLAKRKRNSMRARRERRARRPPPPPRPLLPPPLYLPCCTFQ
jgi:hypothetical protein